MWEPRGALWSGVSCRVLVAFSPSPSLRSQAIYEIRATIHLMLILTVRVRSRSWLHYQHPFPLTSIVLIVDL